MARLQPHSPQTMRQNPSVTPESLHALFSIAVVAAESRGLMAGVA